jgi:hypothetical protein
MLLWDGCHDPDLPPYNPRQAMVLAADGATMNDTFFIVGVCRHPIYKDEWADQKMRIVKREASMKIDGAVALSMALDRAKSWNIS